jgi:flavin reductase (DIM6/NTAB) family NADH-FMN oxidoreductase RutF
MTGPADPVDGLMASLDAALVVVTVAAGDERAGCLVGFHTQTSIDPVRYSVWLSKANRTFDVALHATHLGIHLLTDGDHDLARLFGGVSSDEVDKFARVPVETSVGGVPVLGACPHRMVVRITAVLDEGGDHVCFVTAPVEVTSAGRFDPLRLSAVDDIDPGHEADELPRPPPRSAAG